MSKTINQALKELYLSLGGDPSALEDNSTVSDYIADLENGLKGLAELPAPSSDNSGKIAKVVSDGEGGYIWGAEDETSELPAPAVGDIGKIVGAVSDGESGAEYGLIDKPSDIYVVKATWNDFQVSFTEGEASRLVDAVNAGKTLFMEVSGLSAYSNSGKVLLNGTVLDGFSECWGMVYFTGVANKGVAVFRASLFEFTAMVMNGEISGTQSIYAFPTASQN